MTNENKKIIYDFVSNNGDNIPYYLKKADLVVAVEANPLLCDRIRSRFSNELSENRLIVESVVLTDGKPKGDVFFYSHKTTNALSQFPEPKNLGDFEKILLPSESVVNIISKYGDPYYVKIDVEHYDEAILRALLESNIKPPFISAESHSIEIFALLVALGGYKSFKLVEGGRIAEIYHNHRISTFSGSEIYPFSDDSAGPFGEDLNGDWMTADNFFRLLGAVGLGWKDIHATTAFLPDISSRFRKKDYIKMIIEKKFRKVF